MASRPFGYVWIRSTNAYRSVATRRAALAVAQRAWNTGAVEGLGWGPGWLVPADALGRAAAGDPIGCILSIDGGGSLVDTEYS
jgi:hypothetical protein